MGQIVMGIDPGTVEMGYAICEPMKNSRWKLLESGTWKLDNKMPVIDFLNEMHKLIISSIIAQERKNKKTVKIICVEKMFLSHSNTSAILLNIIPRSIEDLCKKSGQKFQLIHNATIKKRVTGNGRAKKEEVAKAVRKILKLKGKYNHNETDAMSIALAYKDDK